MGFCIAVGRVFVQIEQDADMPVCQFPDDKDRDGSQNVFLLAIKPPDAADLRLENFVTDVDGHCKLVDFGLSKLGMYRGHVTITYCGMPCYKAPEIVQGLLYGQEVEWWAFGVVMCTMLMGRPPFYDTDECRLADKIRKNEVKYSKPILRAAALIVSKVMTAFAIVACVGYGLCVFIHNNREVYFFPNLHSSNPLL